MEKRCTKCHTVRTVQYWFRYKTNRETNTVRNSRVCLLCYRRCVEGGITEQQLIERDRRDGRDTMAGDYLAGQPRPIQESFINLEEPIRPNFVINPTVRVRSWPLVETPAPATLSERMKQPSGRDRLS